MVAVSVQYKEGLMIPRYNERLAMRCPVIFAGNAYLSEGHVLNLTTPGCLIESASPANRGDYVQLKMVLPGLKVPFYVEVAAVRWAGGGQFGVEFIQMSETDQASLSLFLSRYLPTIVSHTLSRRRLSGRGAVRTHIQSWSLHP